MVDQRRSNTATGPTIGRTPSLGSARDVMITAAERLVAGSGLASMSLREVQSLAQQRNKSAAQYHFGSRDGLIEAVVLTRMGAVNTRRRELLDALDADAPDAGAHPEPLRALVEALVVPLAEQTFLLPDSCWARFILQCYSDPTVSELVRRSVESEPYREVYERLVAAIDRVPTALRGRRVDHVVGLVFMSIAAAESARDSGAPMTVPVHAQTEDLIDTCVAILGADCSTATLAALESP